MSENNAPKFPKVSTIDYTPQTLAAAIAKNIRQDIENRDVKAGWNQATWSSLNPEVLRSSKTINFDLGSAFGESDQYVGVSCGTSACTAGWAVILSGGVLAFSKYNFARLIDPDLYTDDEEIIVSEVYDPKRKELISIPTWAQELLNLTNREHTYLFDIDRNEAQVLESLDAISSGKTVSQSAGYIHVMDRHGAFNYDQQGNNPRFDDCIHCFPPRDNDAHVRTADTFIMQAGAD